MENIREMAAKLDADRREAWERMSFGERLLTGASLFEMNIMMMRTGIRLQHPNATDETVEQIVHQQLREARRRELNR